MLSNKTKRAEYDDKMNFYRNRPKPTMSHPTDNEDYMRSGYVDKHDSVYKEFYDREFGHKRPSVPQKDPFYLVWNAYKQKQEEKNIKMDKKAIIRLYLTTAFVLYLGIIATIYFRNSLQHSNPKFRQTVSDLPEDHPMKHFQNSLKGPRTVMLDDIDSSDSDTE